MAEVFDFNLTGGFSTPQQSYQEKLAADLKAATDRGEVVWENGQARSVNRSAIRPPSFSGSAGLAATGFVLPRAAPAFRDYLEAELRRQGYRDSPDGWIPPNASLTQADFDEGVRRIGVAYEREHAAPEREAVDTATSIVDWQSRRRQGAEEAQNIRGNTAEGPALPADTVVGRQRIQDAQGRPTNEFRTSVGVRRPEPDLSPRAVLSSVGRTPENARLVLSEAMRDYDAVNPRIPYVTPALETVRGFAGRALENAPGIRETSAIQRAIGLPVTSGQVARYGAESAVPTRGLDIALTAAPFAGKAVEGARALPGVGRALAGRAVEAGPAMRGVAEGVGPVFPARQPPASVAGRAVKGAGEVKPAAAPEMPTVRPGGRRVTASPAAVEPPVRPPAPPREPPTVPREPVFPRPSSLNPVSKLAFEAQTSSDAFVESAVGRVSKLPVIHTAVDLVNPSALTSVPPARLIAELGEEGATKLQASLIGHVRRTDQANSLAAAIEDGVKQRARALGFKIEGARVVSVPEKPFVGDLFENPSKYTLTTPQRQFVDDIRAVLDDMNAVEKASGVKKNEVFSGEGRYFPRRVLTSSEGVANLKPGVKRLTGAKQSFQKGRFYEYMEEGAKNGVDYLGDISALVGIRIRAGLKAAADQEVAALVRPLGHTLEGGVGAKIGEMGTMVPAVGGRVFPQETAKRLIDVLGTRFPGDIERAANIANNVLRPLEAMGDMGYLALQGLATAFRNPAGFAKGVGVAFDALITDGRFYGKYLLNNREQLERFIAAGYKMRGNEMSFEAAAKGKKLSWLFGRGPFGRLGAGFDNAMNVMGLENAKAIAGISKTLGPSKVSKGLRFVLGDFKGTTDDAVAAAIANKMTGRVSSQSLGVSAAQRSIEGIAAFAPNYYRAAFGLFADALQGGMRGAEGRRVLAGLVGGAVTTHVMLAKALDQDVNLDPTSSKFLTVKVRGVNVGIGGPLHGIIRTIAEAAENPDDLNDILSMNNPVTRWARGRLSPIISLAVDIAAGEDYLGRKISTPGQVAGRVGLAGAPFAVGTAIREGPEEAVAQFFGLRAFPQSDFETRDQSRESVAQEKFGKPYRELFEDQQRQVDADERVAKAVEKATKGSAERGSAIAQSQLADAKDREEAQAQAKIIDARRASSEITPSAARAAYDAEVQRLAESAERRRSTPDYLAAVAEIEKSGRKLTYAEQAQEDYYNVFEAPGVKNRDGSLNFEAYDAALADWQKKYPDVSKEQVSPARPLSRGHAELINDRATLREYFDVRDEAWRQLSKDSPEMSKYSNLDSYRESLVLDLSKPAAQGGGGLSNAEADRLADKMVQKFSESASRLALNYLKAHPDLVPVLDRWGYYVPADVRKLAVPAASPAGSR